MKYFLLALVLIASNGLTFYFSSKSDRVAEPLLAIEEPEFRMPEVEPSYVPDLEVEERPEPLATSLSELGEYLIALDNSEVRSRLLEVFVAYWFAHDHQALATWINDQPQAADVDVAVATFSRLAADMDPEVSVGWAASVEDPVLRESALFRTASRFRAYDPAGFKRFMGSNSPTVRVIHASDFYSGGYFEESIEEAVRYDIIEDPAEPIASILSRRTRLAGASSRVNTVELDQ